METITGKEYKVLPNKMHKSIFVNIITTTAQLPSYSIQMDFSKDLQSP